MYEVLASSLLYYRLRPPTTGSGHRGSGHRTATAIAAHTGYPRRLRPGPSLPSHPDIMDTRTQPPPYRPPTPPLIGRRGGVFFRCWVPTSRCRARLTLRSPPTRTRRALFGRHAAADDLRRIISSLAGCLRPPGANSKSSFCSNDSLGRPHLHSPSLACRVFLIKNKFSHFRQKSGLRMDGARAPSPTPCRVCSGCVPCNKFSHTRKTQSSNEVIEHTRRGSTRFSETRYSKGLLLLLLFH